MPWVRLDEQFAQHPKLRDAGPLALAMQVAGLCYSNQYLTDGFIPRRVAPALLNLEGIAMNCWSNDLIGGGDDATWQLVVNDLVAADLWDETDGGWVIHDFHKYQPSKADVLAERKQKSEAGRIGGQNSAKTRRAQMAQPSPNEAGAQANAKHPPKQNPSDPPSEIQARTRTRSTKPGPAPAPSITDRGAGPGSENEQEDFPPIPDWPRKIEA